MKVIKLYFFSFFLVFSLQSFPQSFYPLQTGNQWVYCDSSYDIYGYFDVDTSFVKVIGDTVFPNGKKYFVLDGSEFAYAKYVREDSSGVYYYEPGYEDETLFYRFDLPIDTQYIVNFGPYMFAQKVAEGNTILFGTTSNWVEFYFDGLAVIYIVLSNKFGPISCLDLGDPPGMFTTDRSIIGAVISDTVYGYIPTAVSDYKIRDMGFRLEQNYPNPFNPVTTIKYTIPNVGTSFMKFVKLKVYNTLGEEVAILVNEEKPAGSYSVKFNGSNLPSGVYIYRLTAGSYSAVKKLVLLK